MKLLGLAAVLMVGMVGWGQSCPSGSLPGNEFSPYTHGEKTPVTHCWNNLTGKATALLPAPLKCGKYEHVEHWPGRCGPSSCMDNGSLLSSCDAVCTAPPPDKCVPDMHEVTEKEWQELQQRLRKLESEKVKAEAYRGAGLKSSIIAEQCLHDLGECRERADMARKMVQNLIDDIKTHSPQ